MSAPTPDDIRAHREQVRELVATVRRAFRLGQLHSLVVEGGWLAQRLQPEHGDLLIQLEELEQELEVQALMMLIASIEGMFRTDHRLRLARRLKDPVSKRLQELSSSNVNTVSWETILDVWRDTSGAASLVDQLKQHIQNRHWVAHGRHWTNKSGAPVRFVRALDTWRRLEQRLNLLNVGFPLIDVGPSL